jgi:hypothetical protein
MISGVYHEIDTLDFTAYQKEMGYVFQFYIISLNKGEIRIEII